MSFGWLEQCERSMAKSNTYQLSNFEHLTMQDIDIEVEEKCDRGRARKRFTVPCQFYFLSAQFPKMTNASVDKKSIYRLDESNFAEKKGDWNKESVVKLAVGTLNQAKLMAVQLATEKLFSDFNSTICVVGESVRYIFVFRVFFLIASFSGFLKCFGSAHV